MAAPIYIKVGDAAEGADLARSLGRHGLLAALVRADALWQVEISSPREDARSFLADVGVRLPPGVEVSAMAYDRTATHAPPPDGACWFGALARGGPGGERARLRLRAFMAAVGWFELERRRAQLPLLSTADAARLVRDAAEAACSAVLTRLDEYHGQSRFHVWAAKFAIHETTVAARRASQVRTAPPATQTLSRRRASAKEVPSER